jgi:short-subunit dehydrogenase
MINILITGGSGDWAQSFKEKYTQEYNIETPNRKELDVSCQKSITAYFDKNNFDVVINNAGSIHPFGILESNTELWINDIQVNLIGTFLISKSALHANRNTTVINISSTAGFNSYPDWSSYCASKSGVITLSKCLAKDGFNVYCLCPGAIDTKFRNKFNLPNDNIMNCDNVSDYVIDILSGNYSSGDVLFFRKNEMILNPDKLN